MLPPSVPGHAGVRRSLSGRSPNEYEAIPEARDLGWMFYDFDYSTTPPGDRFFRAELRDGRVEVPPPGSLGGALVILQALADYYERKRAADPDRDPRVGVRTPGDPFRRRPLRGGRVPQHRGHAGRGGRAKRKGRTFLVPKAAKRAGRRRSAPASYGTSPTTRWDSSRRERRQKRVQEAASGLPREESRRSLVADPEDTGLRALLAFLQAGALDTVRTHATWS